MTRSRRASCAGALGALILQLAHLPSAHGQGAPIAFAAGDGVRLRHHDTGTSYRDASSIWSRGGAIELEAVRGETLGFQIFVETGAAPVKDIALAFDSEPAPGVRLEAFIEHALEVSSRSMNRDRRHESLGWMPVARPPDDRMLGFMPDALIPLGHDSVFSPNGKLSIGAHEVRGFWIDAWVDADAAPGLVQVALDVERAGEPIDRFDVELTIRPGELPYRPVSTFTFYGIYELESRFDQAWMRAERQLWQLLHAHHVDAIASGVVDVDAVERLRDAYDGSLFTATNGYLGPGVGIGPELVVLGTYGELKEPTPASVDAVRTMAPRVPESIDDVFVYAIDEQCDSDRGARWVEALRRDADLDRIAVAHTCHEDPRTQDVDIVMMPAGAFDAAVAREVNDAGEKKVWIYNGQLPRAGAPLLDAPLTALTANGWIHAAYGPPRWFYWESTFWNDDNPGGLGPVEVWQNPVTFNNPHGDVGLFDGLLVYPGRQAGRLPPSSANHPLAEQWYEGLDVGYDGVLPSMRLKALRRGILDAGLIAMARSQDPVRTDALLMEIVPRALTDAEWDEPTPFELQPASLEAARREVRRLASGASPSRAEVRAQITAGAAALSGLREERATKRTYRLLGAAALVLLLGASLAWGSRRRG